MSNTMWVIADDLENYVSSIADIMLNISKGQCANLDWNRCHRDLGKLPMRSAARCAVQSYIRRARRCVRARRMAAARGLLKRAVRETASAILQLGID